MTESICVQLFIYEECNRNRFPKDFMFQPNPKEYASLKSQIVISSWCNARRAGTYAFTEKGVAIRTSVLRRWQACHRGQYRHHARLCEAARDAEIE